MIDSEMEVVEDPIVTRSTVTSVEVGQRPRKPLRGGERASVSALTDAVISACQASASGGATSSSSTSSPSSGTKADMQSGMNSGLQSGLQSGRAPRAAVQTGKVLDKALPLAIVLLIATLGVWFITVGQQPGSVSEAIADSGMTEATGASTTQPVAVPAMSLVASAMEFPVPAMSVVDPLDAAIDWQADPQIASELKQLARENRELDATVEALEQETVDLEREMLDLDLQLATLSTGADVDAEASDPAASPHLSIDIDERPGTLAGAADKPLAVPNHAEESDESITASYASVEVSRQPTADDLLSDEPFLPDAALEMVAAAADAADDNDIAQPQDIEYQATDPGAGRAGASELLGLPVERLAIAEASVGSLAKRSMLAPGDLILAIDGLPLTGFDDLAGHHANVPDEMHDVEILRDERRMHVTIAGSPLDLILRTEYIDPANLVE